MSASSRRPPGRRGYRRHLAVCPCTPWDPIRQREPVNPSRYEVLRLPRTSSMVTAMPAPRWFWRFMYDRESASWVRRRDEPEHRELVERMADRLARVVPAPGPVADLG